MTETSISLVSIIIGIIGANIMGFIFKKYTFGIIGNSIAGVFGSVFFIKSLGRLGFDPISIMQSGTLNAKLLILNLLISFIGGFIAIVFAKKLKNKMNKV